MAERYIKIELSRTQTTEVYVRVDDANVPLVAQDALVRNGAIQELARRAADELFDDDWSDLISDADSVEIKGVVEVPAAEAKDYGVYCCASLAACPACEGKKWGEAVRDDTGKVLRVPPCEACGGRGWKEEAGAGT